MNELMGVLDKVFGLQEDPQRLTMLQVIARAGLVFVATLVYVRLGDKRFLSRKTAFDAVLGFILASMMARAINGSAALGPTLAAGLVLVALHRGFAFLATRWHPFGVLIKGSSRVVVRDGVVDQEALREHNFSERDLLEDLRLNGGVSSVKEVAEATVERNGQVSVVKLKRPISGG